MNILITYFHQAFIQDQSEEKRIASEICNLATSAGHKAEILSFPFDTEQQDQIELIYSYNNLIIDNTSLLISINSPACYLSHNNHYSVWTKTPELLLPDIIKTIQKIFITEKNLIKKIDKEISSEIDIVEYSEINKLF